MTRPAEPEDAHAFTRIESQANPRFRALLALVDSAHERRKRGRSVLEGHKLIESFVSRAGADDDGAALHELYVSESALGRGSIRLLLQRAAIAPVVLDDRLLKRASRQATPDGTIAVIETPVPRLPERLRGDMVYLDGLQDPGNLGTILRSCAAAGIGTVLTSPDTAFCWSPKVLRAGMGAHFALMIHEGVTADELWRRLDPAQPVWATTAPGAEASRALYEADLKGAGLWLFGAEGQGLGEELLVASVHRLSIPQVRAVESMNVAAAVAVCLFEQRRQRLCE
ncbi:MAG: RNA methyltransferase [Burkholderiaceae bacterium]